MNMKTTQPIFLTKSNDVEQSLQVFEKLKAENQLTDYDKIHKDAYHDDEKEESDFDEDDYSLPDRQIDFTCETWMNTPEITQKNYVEKT